MMLPSGRLALVAAAFLVLAIDPMLATAPAGDGGPVSRRGTYAGGSYLIEVPAGWNGGLVIFADGYGEASASPLASHLAATGYAWAACGSRRSASPATTPCRVKGSTAWSSTCSGATCRCACKGCGRATSRT